MPVEEARRSVLATTPHLQEGFGITNGDREAGQAVAEGFRDAKAANTRRAYKTAWHLFCDWALITDRQAIPAEPQTVALYLGNLVAAGKAIATIEQARAAISPTPTLRRAYRRGTIQPAIPLWPRSSRASAIRLQRPDRPALSPTTPWLRSARLSAFPGAAAVDAWSQQPSHKPGAPRTWQSSE